MSERLLEEERLDELLWMLESEPPDNGFTKRVMTRIETPSLSYRVVQARLASWRRFITRPMALAAALLLLMGVAYAAIVTTSPTQPGSNKDEGAQERPRPGDESASKDVRDGIALRPKAQASSSPSPTMRNATAEYGYTSSHTAYVIDQGLRLETETYSNNLKIEKPHKITLTLQNLTNERIVVYGQKGCLLAVSIAKHEEDSSADDGRLMCTSSDGTGSGYPSKSESEYTVLEPHAKRVEHAVLTVSEAGEWGIIGLCNCFNRYKSQPSPSPSPSGIGPDLPLQFRLSDPQPQIGRTPAPQEGYGRMFTPPIKMQAE